MSTIFAATGIDLGSTTSKAVLLDENHEVLGRGITNSRSNYDVACAVARAEALVDARFTLVRRALAAESLLRPDATEELLGAITRAFRETQYRRALAILGTSAAIEAGAERYSGFRPHLARAVESILVAMTEEAAQHFVRGADGAQQFFRDLASSAYARLASLLVDRRLLPFDLLLGIFDKAILVVENTTLDSNLDDDFLVQLHATLAVENIDSRESAVVAEIVRRIAATEIVEVATVGTGTGRARLPFPRELIRSEILCHGLGAHVMFPGTATVLDIGGQDTKAIQVDAAGIVTSFHMNDRCAAGCGRYLGYIADEMNLGLHELGPLAMSSTRQVKINSTCTVFAGAELRERLSLGQRREDILAGLHRSIILRAMSLLARAGGVHDEFTFTGGVARNQAAVQALVQLVEENYGKRQLNISAASIYTGALGAALFAWRSKEGVPAEHEEAAA